ncbi:MAG: helix-turn-helix domain-containing protein [Phenylobacterium sp.]|uniref:helix-turn-helix domain-containing protein n=1 Tax=Phenylobacterium sp. TaxID=1871053 RepID=UPI0035638DA6
MTLTTHELAALRRIAIRAIEEVHDVFASAAARQPSAPARTAAAGPASPPTIPKPKPRMAFGLAEASQLLGLSRSKLYSMIADGEIRSVRLGSRRLIEASEIEALLARSRN